MKLFFITILCMLLTFSCQSLERSSYSSVGEVILNGESRSTCVRNLEEGKIYLDESLLIPTSKGLFLMLQGEGEYLHLTELFSDSLGCYIPSPEMGSPDAARGHMPSCPKCGWGGYLAGYCKNPNCVLNQ